MASFDCNEMYFLLNDGNSLDGASLKGLDMNGASTDNTEVSC